MCSIVKRVIPYILLLIGIAHAYAAPVYEAQWPEAQPMQSQQILTTGVTYHGTIYTPFDNITPSDLSEVGGGYPPKKRLYTETQDDRNPGEATEGSELSPVGEPWVMVFFALLFAGAIAWRQHHIQIKTETRK